MAGGEALEALEFKPWGDGPEREWMSEKTCHECGGHSLLRCAEWRCGCGWEDVTRRMS